MDGVKRLLFWLRSFSKREWAFEDYPITVRQMDSGEHLARILGWAGLAGIGSSAEAAKRSLAENFDQRRANGKNHARPGCRVPLEFADSSRISGHGEFAYSFVEEMTNIRPFFMSDETTLGDFAESEEEGEEIRVMIREEYGVDIEGVLGVPLPDVLDRVRGF